LPQQSAVWRHDNFVQACLVRGDHVHHLLVGVEDPLGPLGCLMGHSLCDGHCQRHVLFSEEVLLQLHIAHPVDEQAEDDRLVVVELSLADDVSAGELHLTLPGFGLEVGEEALHGLAWLLPDSVELSGPCLHSLLGDDAGGNYVLKDALLIEVLDPTTEAAVAHLGHVRSEALEELGGAVPVVTEPLLVLLLLVAKVVVLLMVYGLATDGEVGPLHAFCLGAHITNMSSQCCGSFLRRMAVGSVHLDELQCFTGGHVGSLEWDPLRPRVTNWGRARQHHGGPGGDVDGVLPGSQALHFKCLLIIRYEQNETIMSMNSLFDEEICDNVNYWVHGKR
jgi:hypothetical protein